MTLKVTDNQYGRLFYSDSSASCLLLLLRLHQWRWEEEEEVTNLQWAWCRCCRCGCDNVLQSMTSSSTSPRVSLILPCSSCSSSYVDTLPVDDITLALFRAFSANAFQCNQLILTVHMQMARRSPYGVSKRTLVHATQRRWSFSRALHIRTIGYLASRLHLLYCAQTAQCLLITGIICMHHSVHITTWGAYNKIHGVHVNALV